jgi:hypothetical protein
MFKQVLLSVAMTALVPAVAVAGTPTAFFEGSQIVGTGTSVRSYRVPTRDGNGVIKYYDVTVTFKLLPDGRIDTTSATIGSVLSPDFATNKFIPGTYKDAGGNVCTVAVSTLNGGRGQSVMTCRTTNGYTLSASWITGLIPGHPFELDLRAAAIDKIPGYQNFAWGKVGSTSYGHDWWRCMSPTNILSATQVGNVIYLSGYDNSNIQKCGVTLTKQ